MILKILGSLDIISALIFFLSIHFNISKTFLMIIAFYLLIKGVIFLISKDIASILDVVCAAVIFLSLTYTIPYFAVILICLFLTQKGVFSWLA